MILIENGVVKQHVSNPITQEYQSRRFAATLELKTSRSKGYKISGINLPATSELTEAQKLILCDGAEYNPEIIATVAIAARHAVDKGEYERMLGLYACGYRSDFRKNVMFRWNNAFMGSLTLTDLKRELRRMFHEIKLRNP